MTGTTTKKGKRRKIEPVDAKVIKTPEVPENRRELRILQAIRRIMRGVDSHSRLLMSSYDLTTPQLICLLNIIERDNRSSPSHIAREIYLSPSTVIGILDRLEQKGLIKRERDTKDRRVVNVSATPRGIKLAKKAPSPLQDSLISELRKLPVKEQTAITRALERIVTLMEIEHLDAAPILDGGHTIRKAGKKPNQSS